MSKKSKPTREFSPMAKRIYNYVLKAVNARSQGLTVLRQIDREIEKIKVGNPDLELKEQMVTLEGQVANANEEVKNALALVEEHDGVIATMKDETAGFKSELKNAQELVQSQNEEIEELNKKASEYEKFQEEYQKVSNENDNRGLEIIHLNEKIAELESAGSDSAETTDTDKEDSPDADPKEEKPDAEE